MEYMNALWMFAMILYTVLTVVKSQPMPDGYPSHKSPVLDASNQLVEVIAGETAVLPCAGTNMEGIEITWFKDSISTILAVNGNLFTDDLRLTIEPISTSGQEVLKISNVTVNDSNQYTCMLNTMPPSMKYFELVVKAPAKIDKSSMMEYYQYVEGESKEIVCEVQGSPPPQVKWYFYKTKTDQQTETRDLVSRNKHLVLNNLHTANEGIYGCEAKNEVGEDMYEIFLQEIYKPKLYTTMKRTVAKLGSLVRLQCEVESNPVATVHWQRNEQLIDNTWEYSIQQFADSKTKIISVLSIQNSDYSDNGLYLCIASNILGRDNIRMYLTVEDPSASTTTEARTKTTMKATQKPRTVLTTLGYKETKSPDNLIITSTTTGKLDLPRTEASVNKGSNSDGNSGLGLVLGVLLTYWLS